ncbi:hypothetical protein L596_025107 [Steinernema carpocapsae]|uniref:Uncharacterized protein n=1 Tax=Steinernema carpocapsae TaxID=34508 RepID=A0A4U5M6U8_STECR|nr:hypothetical protein L596_025107 [Steinernema carpocapsae]
MTEVKSVFKDLPQAFEKEPWLCALHQSKKFQIKRSYCVWAYHISYVPNILSGPVRMGDSSPGVKFQCRSSHTNIR